MRGTNAAELVTDIERQISEGILQPGDRLPPVRRLAHELTLAPNTVAAAYRRLGERGMVVGRGRNGTFIAPRPPVAIPVEPEVTEGLVDLALGNPDPMLLPRLRVDHGGEPVLYGHESFDADLRRLARETFAEDGVPPDHLTVVAGALDGLERILSGHLRPGDRVAIEDPAFFSVIDLLGALGLIPVPVAIDDIGLKPEPLAGAIRSGISAIVHTPRGQNPFWFGDVRSETRRIGDDHRSRTRGADRGRRFRERRRRSPLCDALWPRSALVGGDPISSQDLRARPPARLFRC